MKFLILFFILSVGAVVGSKIDWSAGGSWSTGGSSTTGQGGGFSVPELDPGVAGSAIVLLLGGVAYLASRRREGSST
jgi:hypothetical protein